MAAKVDHRGDVRVPDSAIVFLNAGFWIGAAYRSEAPAPLFPKWLSIASVFGAVLLAAAAGGPAFFKSGPFAYHGWPAFYMQMVIWALWLVGAVARHT